MADAQIRIDGRIATDPRYNQVNGKDVANLRVLGGPIEEELKRRLGDLEPNRLRRGVLE